jgi:nucleoside-diphosphate-sugar epimerase
MRILITGNTGYIGPVVASYLKNKYPNITLIGFDAGYFAHSLSAPSYLPEVNYEIQYFSDIREINPTILHGIDAIVHLSAISNDPMGNEFENITKEINLQASINLIKLAVRGGVKNFVFASSCSMYGAGGELAKSENDPTNPLTAYAQSKIGVEEAVKNINLGDMVFTSLRFATACGISDRLRLDLVLNDFVASAILYNKITVLSDGSPWRPLIDVKDMARAIDWAIHRETENGGKFLAINIGKNENNYQVKDLAEAVAEEIPGTIVSINKKAQPDTRSYRVNFSLFEKLAPDFIPKISLQESINGLKTGILKMNFNNNSFRESEYMRLNSIRNHLAQNRLDRDLRWVIGTE